MDGLLVGLIRPLDCDFYATSDSRVKITIFSEKKIGLDLHEVTIGLQKVRIIIHRPFLFSLNY